MHAAHVVAFESSLNCADSGTHLLQRHALRASCRFRHIPDFAGSGVHMAWVVIPAAVDLSAGSAALLPSTSRQIVTTPAASTSAAPSSPR